MKTKIRVKYDVRMIGHSGIGTQIRNVVGRLAADSKIELALIGDPEVIEPHLPDKFKGRLIPFRAPIYSLKEQFGYPAVDADELLIAPHYNAPVRRLKRAVVVLHDLIHLHSVEFAMPHYRLYAYFMLSRIARRALRVVTVSEYTRDDFLSHFPQARDKTTVIHNGVNHKDFKKPARNAVAAFRKEHGLPAKYLLAVGIGKKHKNVDFVIRSLAPFWRDGSLKYPLVLGGAGGHLPAYITDSFTDQDVLKHVMVLPHLPNDDLRKLYGGATLLIMPSLLEGFGFPVLEAMACGTPVLSSAVTSLPEVGGSAAVYFDPADPLDFTDRLMDLLNNKSRLAELSQAGLKQAANFSWDKYCENLTRVLGEVAANP